MFQVVQESQRKSQERNYVRGIQKAHGIEKDSASTRYQRTVQGCRPKDEKGQSSSKDVEKWKEAWPRSCASKSEKIGENGRQSEEMNWLLREIQYFDARVR